MSGDKENWRCNALGGQLVSQINPGHAGQLDVEDKANKSRLLLIRAERFGGSVSDRLHPCRAQQSSDRAPQTFVIVDDTYIEIAYAANHHGDKITGHTALALLPFREAAACPGQKSDRRRQAHTPFSRRASRGVAKQHVLDRRQVFRGGRYCRAQRQFVARRWTVGQQPGKCQATNQRGHAAEVDEAMLPEIQDYLLPALMSAPAVPACSATTTTQWPLVVWRGQPEQQLLKPSAKGRIRLTAVRGGRVVRETS